MNIPEAESTLYRSALAEAHRQHLPEAVRDLRLAGPPPWAENDDKKLLAKTWQRRLEGPLPKRVTARRYFALASTSPAYSPLDFIKGALGAARSYAPLRDDIYAADLFHEVPRLEVPAWFLMGRHDTVVSDAVLARYFQKLQAPRGKHLIWFEHSAHAPHLEEPEKYRAVLTQIARGDEHTPTADVAE